MAFVPKYILILFFVILVDYIAGLTIEHVNGRLKLFYLIGSLIINISLLAYKNTWFSNFDKHAKYNLYLYNIRQ